MYHIIRLLAQSRKFVPEIVLLWLKNRNQCVHTGGLICGGAYTWSNRSVKEKVGLSVGAYTWGGLIGGEIWYTDFELHKLRMLKVMEFCLNRYSLFHQQLPPVWFN